MNANTFLNDKMHQLSKKLNRATALPNRNGGSLPLNQQNIQSVARGQMPASRLPNPHLDGMVPKPTTPTTFTQPAARATALMEGGIDPRTAGELSDLTNAGSLNRVSGTNQPLMVLPPNGSMAPPPSSVMSPTAMPPAAHTVRSPRQSSTYAPGQLSPADQFLNKTIKAMGYGR